MEKCHVDAGDTQRLEGRLQGGQASPYNAAPVIHSVMVRATAEPIASGQAGGTKSVQASASTWPF